MLVFSMHFLFSLLCGKTLPHRVFSSAMPPTCGSCGTVEEPGVKLNLCARCKTVHYCSRECQAADWKTGGHKALCKDVSSPAKKLTPEKSEPEREKLQPGLPEDVERELKKLDFVELQGLVSLPHLNGRRGIIEDFDQSNLGRFKVFLVDDGKGGGKPISIKAENLKRTATGLSSFSDDSGSSSDSDDEASSANGGASESSGSKAKSIIWKLLDGIVAWRISGNQTRLL